MSKKLLLSGLICMCSISIANALCIPPATLKCDCAHPIINSEGKLACGTSYCGNKKCMPDGSCCSEANFCQVGNDKYCCSEGQTCDIVKGCVDAKENIETLCTNAGGTVITASSGTFCMSKNMMTWYDAEKWCQENGMTMPTIREVCPTWAGDLASWIEDMENGRCYEISGTATVWTASLDNSDNNYAYIINLFSSFGTVMFAYRDDPEDRALCY